MLTFQKGSEWRIWDLHVHTPCSVLNNEFGSDWDIYVKNLYINAIEKNIACIGITDYYSIEGYKRLVTEYLQDENKLKVLFEDEIQNDYNFLDKVKDITIFPNVEFRCKDVLIEKGKDNKFEVHVIFSNEISIEEIETKFFSKINFIDEIGLKTSSKSPLLKNNIETFGKSIKDNNIDAWDGKSNYWVGCNCLAIELEDIFNVLNNEQALTFENKFILLMPEDDISDVKWNTQAYQVKKHYYAKAHGFFSTSPKTIEWGLSKVAKEEFNSIKPCFSCSDAHSFKSLFKFKSDKLCWIKSDTTFMGLMQVFYSPTERIYLGKFPEKLDKVNKSKYHYIDRIVIDKNVSANNSICWFNTDLLLNPGLVAIIGNKGSGKSALADILGYMTDSENMYQASFLNEKRFKKEDKKYAYDYQAKLFWLDGKIIEKKTLMEKIVEVQSSEYLPQKFIEDLCNELNDNFQNEIDKVIFSYIDNSDKLNANNLDELKAIKTQEIDSQIQIFKNRIETVNKEIINLEKKYTAEYRAEVLSNLNKKQAQLKSHVELKPKEVKKQNTDFSKQLEKLNIKLESLENEIEQNQSIKKSIKIKINAIEQFLSKWKNMEGQIKELITYANNDLKTTIDFDGEIFFKLNSNVHILKDYKEKLDGTLLEINASLDEEYTEADLKSLFKTKDLIINEKNEILGQAQDDEIKYETYLNELKQWEETKVIIEGNETSEDGINYFQRELDFIDNKLFDEYIKKLKDREIIVCNIYELYLEKVEIYKKLYEPVESKLSNILKDNSDNIQFETIIKLSINFCDEFLQYIKQNVISNFQGKKDGMEYLQSLIREANFNEWSGFSLFYNKIISSINEDKDRISKLVTNREACYDFISKLEYLKPQFTLKMDGKTLDELSPGQRGNVLLIFYLALSKNSEPIIIDQPEDNLDNQSVYNKLVPCIIEAKKNRQVIIVTHNPNIAVACDAEQVICSSIDKTKNQISYMSGAIENPIIRKQVVDILEGTMPAFSLRKLKYMND